jgi:hypothetical protein
MSKLTARIKRLEDEYGARNDRLCVIVARPLGDGRWKMQDGRVLAAEEWRQLIASFPKRRGAPSVIVVDR